MFLGTRTTFIGLFLLGEQQQQKNITFFDIIFGKECLNLNLIFKATLRPVRLQVTPRNLTCNTGYYGSGTIGSSLRMNTMHGKCESSFLPLVLKGV